MNRMYPDNLHPVVTAYCLIQWETRIFPRFRVVKLCI